MSLSPLDPSTVRAAAQAALDARLGLIDAIVAAQNERTAAATKVAEAEASERAAASKELASIKSALDGGWSATELRAAGLKVPHSINKKSTSTQAAPRTSTRTSRPSRPRVTTPQPDLVSDSSTTERQPDAQHAPGASYANAS
ncbi:hypothetical protein [Rhodococcoides fascians]|uniref:hypothetical protein n=1 Tax=Rhodococcoides fascians TaxID=1828 RepID=UPI000564A25F|nr:hypothetical protein [Rhodococcus fascians]